MGSKKSWLGILAVVALVLGMMVVGCDDSGGSTNVTEAYINVSGLTSNVGKYLRVQVFPLGNNFNQINQAILWSSSEPLHIDADSVRIKVYNDNDEDDIDLNAK